MARHANVAWNLHPTSSDGTLGWDSIRVAVLMDIRDRLDVIARRLAPLECSNFTNIPRTLRRIATNTARPKKAAKRRPKSTRGG